VTSPPSSVRYLLIGGGLASFHAARQIRRSDPDGSILIACDEPSPPYDRPPLSKEYLRGEKIREEIALAPAEALAEERIDLALADRAESLAPAEHQAQLASGRSIKFDKALIATGGRPIVLNLPGAGLDGIHYLRTLEDADGIAASAVPGRRAAIIGGGFIGVELAATLRQRGLEVTVIEALPRIWARFADERLSGFIQSYCEQRGVSFRTGVAITGFEGGAKLTGVTLSSGETLPCDLACVGVGIVPNVELAVAAGLEVNDGIVVDELLRSSHPDIYAAGDVINYPDSIFGRRRRVEHWGHAEYGGQVAGKNMAGGSTPYEFLSYVWSDIFDLHLEFAGDETNPERVLQRGGFEDAAFSILYLRGGMLTAFYAINASTRELGSLRRLIQTRQPLLGRESELEDPASNLRALLS
jgi:NADPH-dependent 2,4-dienoyl-CoA reductase/sulfur reductase-like enzyme